MKQTSEPKCTLTDKELVDRCSKEISNMCRTGGSSFTMRVPVDMNNDTDMLLSELVRRFKKVKNIE